MKFCGNHFRFWKLLKSDKAELYLSCINEQFGVNHFRSGKLLICDEARQLGRSPAFLMF